MSSSLAEGSAFRGAPWLPGRHLQTIVPAVMMGLPLVTFRRERWDTPDGDFIDVDFVDAPDESAATVILLHGLEGSSTSHYARSLMALVQERGLRGVVPHFRGCSGTLNRAPRFYHSGDSAEFDWIARRLASLHPGRPLHAAGVSLGGNVLLKWLGERGSRASPLVESAVAISAPMDLAAGGQSLGRGFNMLYTRTFLRSLKPKCETKLVQYPGLFDASAMRAARNLYEFDNAVTAPLHGFRDTNDYWSRASSKSVLGSIEVPTLILNALNDPFLPPQALPSGRDVSRHVRLEYPEHGGHVGFVARSDAPLRWLPERILNFLERQA